MTQAFSESADFYLKTFDRVVASGMTLAGKTFEECQFSHCRFDDAVFEDCRFLECTFRACDLSNLKVAGTRFQTVAFEESKLIGIDWTRAQWSKFAVAPQLLFRKSILNDASFAGLSLPELVLDECKAHHVDFREGDFSRGHFTYTDFSMSLFNDTVLAGADFSEATGYDIDIRRNDVHKARFTRHEAFRLLHGLDVELVD